MSRLNEGCAKARVWTYAWTSLRNRARCFSGSGSAGSTPLVASLSIKAPTHRIDPQTRRQRLQRNVRRMISTHRECRCCCRRRPDPKFLELPRTGGCTNGKCAARTRSVPSQPIPYQRQVPCRRRLTESPEIGRSRHRSGSSGRRAATRLDYLDGTRESNKGHGCSGTHVSQTVTLARACHHFIPHPGLTGRLAKLN